MKVHHNQELPYANSPEEKRREAEIFSKHYYTRDTLEWWISHPYRRHTLRHLTRYLRVRSDLFRDNCRVIEPACGCGVNLTNLAKDFPHYEYFGLDLSLQGVRVASTWGGGCYAVGDAEDIPFGGETFDICLCIAAIHHFHRNPTRFLGEMCRVVKRNGVIYVFEPDFNLRLGLWDRVRARWVKARIRKLNGDEEFTGYGTIPSAPTEGPFDRDLSLRIFKSMGMELVEEGFSEFITEWSRHYAKGFELAVSFDKNLKPSQPVGSWATGGTKYYAILKKK